MKRNHRSAYLSHFFGGLIWSGAQRPSGFLRLENGDSAVRSTAFRRVCRTEDRRNAVLRATKPAAALLAGLATCWLVGAWLVLCHAAIAQPSDVPVLAPSMHADRPCEIVFTATTARFVRITIHQSSRSQPCIDEFEVYGNNGTTNLALASLGGKATASSCLPGYAIHKIDHLNDGHYGNSHSWIAANSADEWAQVELPKAVEVSRVVISRDRDGKYHDRIPVQFDVSVSLDGEQWQLVCRVQGKAAVVKRSEPKYAGPFQLPSDADWEALLGYAFQCERYTWERMAADDHLSPLATDRPAEPGGAPYWAKLARLDSVDRTLFQMEQLIERLAQKGLDVNAEQQQLAELRRRQTQAKADGQPPTEAVERLYQAARHAKRKLMFRDPELSPLQRILFVKRHPYHASHNYSEILDGQFRSGGGVCVLQIPWKDRRLDPQRGRVTTLFDATHGIARDAVVDFDGTTIYFAYRPEKSSVDGWSPYWHVMAIDVDGGNARQLTSGPYHDTFPCPLPDGDIAFISTRVKARFLCWRPQAFVLFRMAPDGTRIRPLSSANLSEWSPSLMRDGRILWTRSEYLDKGADFGHTLWAIHPEGGHPELIFGNNTPNCYINAHEVPGTRELVCTLFSHGGDHNGPIGLIDRAWGPFDTAAVTNITPDVKPHYNMSWARYECFRDPVPISRNYFLVSHAPADHFALYVIDRYGNRELLYLDPAIGSMCPMPLAPRPRPPVLARPRDEDLARAGLGEMTLIDVYQGLAPHVQRGQVKYLRVCEEVRAELDEMPDGQYRCDHEPFQDWYATPIHKVRGPNGWPSYVAKATRGLVPVAEDGSARFVVPAGKVLYFEVLDERFNELQRMRSVVQLQPGERRSCIGCHEDRRRAADIGPLPQSVRTVREPIAPPWGAGPFSYEEVVQPVWDTRCVECHNRSDERGIDLTGTPDADKVPASYRTLVAGGWVHYFDYTYQLRHHKAQPLTFGTLASPLIGVLDGDHYGVRLSESELRAVKCWIDLNCPLWPDYQFRPDRPKK